jgi:hypothetical protein
VAKDQKQKTPRSEIAGPSETYVNAVVLRSSEIKPKAQKGRVKSQGKQGDPPHGLNSKSAEAAKVKQNWWFSA